tara:strand:- start:630 stop:1040 length:411 start_codon:yes stop_codon:yes gene_type:complete
VTAYEEAVEKADEEPLRIWWNHNLHGKITPGKLAAHAAHAALHAYGIDYTHPIVVLSAGKGRIEAMEVVIRDAGHTELTPGTITTGVEHSRDERLAGHDAALLRELAGKIRAGSDRQDKYTIALTLEQWADERTGK